MYKANFLLENTLHVTNIDFQNLKHHHRELKIVKTMTYSIEKKLLG